MEVEIVYFLNISLMVITIVGSFFGALTGLRLIKAASHDLKTWVWVGLAISTAASVGFIFLMAKFFIMFGWGKMGDFYTLNWMLNHAAKTYWVVASHIILCRILGGQLSSLYSE